MLDRREFLRVSGALGAGALTTRVNGIEEIAAATAAVARQTPQQVAQDEFYWREIQQGFALDRTISNLNNGNSCPSPRVVQDALRRYFEFANQAPVRYRGQIEQNLETVRRHLAAEAGCDPEELAITRNASESLQIAQNGIDWKPGDEVITTDQDYPRMLQTYERSPGWPSEQPRVVPLKKPGFWLRAGDQPELVSAPCKRSCCCCWCAPRRAIRSHVPNATTR